ncbi:Clp protease N-terminal domain-containing protein [Streptomyces sp. NPDC050844]|uniref:Clp protease N-terminal domain-containing protein n=1 Tax=Streptomyces sp. NPDC050844 TaxID=3155790 RepID=UPI0033D30325
MTDEGLEYTPRYYKVLGAAEAIARTLGHTHVGTEHLFLAILQDQDAVPTQALAEQIDPQRITDGLTRIMHSAEYSGAPEGDFPRESDL